MAKFNVTWNNSTANFDELVTEAVLRSRINSNSKNKFSLTGPNCAGWVYRVLVASGIYIPRGNAWDMFNYITDREIQFGVDGKGRIPFTNNAPISEYTNVGDGLIFGRYDGLPNIQQQATTALNSASEYKKDKIRKVSGGNLVNITHVGLIIDNQPVHFIGNSKGNTIIRGNSYGMQPIAWWPFLDAMYEALP